MVNKGNNDQDNKLDKVISFFTYRDYITLFGTENFMISILGDFSITFTYKIMDIEVKKSFKILKSFYCDELTNKHCTAGLRWLLKHTSDDTKRVVESQFLGG